MRGCGVCMRGCGPAHALLHAARLHGGQVLSPSQPHLSCCSAAAAPPAPAAPARGRGTRRRQVTGVGSLVSSGLRGARRQPPPPAPPTRPRRRRLTLARHGACAAAAPGAGAAGLERVAAPPARGRGAGGAARVGAARRRLPAAGAPGPAARHGNDCRHPRRPLCPGASLGGSPARQIACPTAQTHPRPVRQAPVWCATRELSGARRRQARRGRGGCGRWAQLADAVRLRRSARDGVSKVARKPRATGKGGGRSRRSHSRADTWGRATSSREPAAPTSRACSRYRNTIRTAAAHQIAARRTGPVNRRARVEGPRPRVDWQAAGKRSSRAGAAKTTGATVVQGEVQGAGRAARAAARRPVLAASAARRPLGLASRRQPW